MVGNAGNKLTRVAAGSTSKSSLKRAISVVLFSGSANHTTLVGHPLGAGISNWDVLTHTYRRIISGHVSSGSQ